MRLYELWHTPSACWLAALAPLLSLFGLVLTLLVTESTSRVEIRGLLSFCGTGGLVMVLGGVVHAAGDYRHRTVVPLALALPTRTPVLYGHLLAYAAAGAVIGLVSGVPVVTTTAVWLGTTGTAFTATAIDVVIALRGGVVYSALSAVLGAGLGTLARNQAAAAIGVAVFLGMVDPLLAGAVPDYGRFGPTVLGIAIAGGAPAPGGPGQVLLPIPVATLVYAGAAALAGLAALAAFRRRELT